MRRSPGFFLKGLRKILRAVDVSCAQSVAIVLRLPIWRRVMKKNPLRIFVRLQKKHHRILRINAGTCPAVRISKRKPEGNENTAISNLQQAAPSHGGYKSISAARYVRSNVPMQFSLPPLLCSSEVSEKRGRT